MAPDETKAAPVEPHIAGLISSFQETYGYPPQGVYRAPGRVNLIGGHTDYNEGFVLPIAIDRAVWMAAAPRQQADRVVRVLPLTLEVDQPHVFCLDGLQPSSQARWSNYVRGVLALLVQGGHPVQGLDLAYHGDVPIGAGLSSSAAVEVVTATAVRDLFDLDVTPLEVARLCQRAEHEFAATQCGLMDQMISVLGRKGQALLIDCRYLTWEAVPLPEDTAVVVCNTGVRRGLADSAYNQRRAQCEEGARLLGLSALRDLDVSAFEARAEELPPLVRKRCRHIVQENERTLRAAEALERGDCAVFGQLMNQSHASLRDLFEVSSDALDLMAELARSQPGCWGARMTGAGFGGCVVALVAHDAVETFVETVSILYERQARRRPSLYVCQASDGAGVEWGGRRGRDHQA
jgi:galactokinase